MYSLEVEKALDEAARLAGGEAITCPDMLSALALTCVTSGQILAKYGFCGEDARSFSVGSGEKAKVLSAMSFSEELSDALVEAKKIALENGESKVYSQHLLLALVKKSGKELSQVIIDYGIDGNEIEDIVKSMAFHKIAESENCESYLTFTVKRKVSFELTQRIYRVLNRQG